MFFKKLSILFAVVLVLFSCSIHTTSALNSIAPTKQSSEIIDELVFIEIPLKKMMLKKRLSL